MQAVVERYDADGIDDSPELGDSNGDGIPDPVRYYQIEMEATNGVWWQGTNADTATAEYLQVLRTAANAARTAYPDARILLAGIPGLDLLDGNPSSEGLQDVVSNIDPAVCGAIEAYAQLLAATDAYDIATAHSLADYSGLDTLGRWLATLAATPKPVWITGATSAPALTADPRSLTVRPLFPAQGEALWDSLKQPADPQHEAVERWYRAEQARLALKKWVYAAWSGFDVVVMGMEQDRPVYENPDLGVRDLAFQGLLDPAGGPEPPAPRPAVPALALAQAQLAGYTAIERLEGLGAGVEAFRFTVEDLPVYVLWYDDGVAQGPGDAPAQTMVHLPVHAPELTALTAPTERGETGPTITTLTPSNGVLTFTLTETPVVLRGEWGAIYLPSLRR